MTLNRCYYSVTTEVDELILFQYRIYIYFSMPNFQHVLDNQRVKKYNTKTDA